MDDEAVPGPALEDPVVILGSGILGHTPFERHTDRWGAVHLTVLDSIPGERAPARTASVPPDEDLAARILQDLAEGDARYAPAAAEASEAAARRPDNRVVAFDHAPLGAAGTLVARVIATDPFYAHDDAPPELRAPWPGERVVLGTGTLFTEQYRDMPIIGVRPGDGRADDWMDHYAIARCRHHLVRLEFETPKDNAPGAGTCQPRADGSPREHSPAICRPGRPARLPCGVPPCSARPGGLRVHLRSRPRAPSKAARSAPRPREGLMTSQLPPDRELREVPATDQAIRGEALPGRTRPADHLPGGTSTDQPARAGGAG